MQEASVFDDLAKIPVSSGWNGVNSESPPPATRKALLRRYPTQGFRPSILLALARRVAHPSCHGCDGAVGLPLPPPAPLKPSAYSDRVSGPLIPLLHSLSSERDPPESAADTGMIAQSTVPINAGPIGSVLAFEAVVGGDVVYVRPVLKGACGVDRPARQYLS